MEGVFLTLSTGQNLHLVALPAIILNREGVLTLIVAGSARFTRLHVAHGRFKCPRLERKYFCVAIGTFITLQVEFVAERGLSAGCLKVYFSRLQSFVALVAVSACRKSVFSVMTASAGVALVHVFHGRFPYNGTIRE